MRRPRPPGSGAAAAAQAIGVPTDVTDGTAVHALRGIDLDAHLVQHPYVQVRMQRVVLAVEGHVASVFEPAAREEDRQVRVVVRRRVAEVARIEDRGAVEQRGIRLG